MGCYGIGPSRVIGTIVEMHHDEHGIIWPKEVAPYQVHLISLCREEDADKAEALYAELTDAGVEVLFDDRAGVRAGQKFADSDLIGIPTRVVISAKTLEQGAVEVKQRAGGEATMVPREELLHTLNS